MPNKKIVFEYFSDAKLALIREVKKHPPLLAQLAADGSKAWSDQIGTIAAYCNVLMDGVYSHEQLNEDLPDKLFWKLAAKRKMTVSPVIGIPLEDAFKTPTDPKKVT